MSNITFLTISGLTGFIFLSTGIIIDFLAHRQSINRLKAQAKKAHQELIEDIIETDDIEFEQTQSGKELVLMFDRYELVLARASYQLMYKLQELRLSEKEQIERLDVLIKAFDEILIEKNKEQKFGLMDKSHAPEKNS